LTAGLEDVSLDRWKSGGRKGGVEGRRRRGDACGRSDVGGRSLRTGHPLTGGPLLNILPRTGDSPATASAAGSVVVQPARCLLIGDAR